MAPKRKTVASGEPSAKKSRKEMSLIHKVEVLAKLGRGESAWCYWADVMAFTNSVGQNRFIPKWIFIPKLLELLIPINESSIHQVKKSAENRRGCEWSGLHAEEGDSGKPLQYMMREFIGERKRNLPLPPPQQGMVLWYNMPSSYILSVG